MTPVIGALASSVPVVFLSIAGGVLSGIVVVVRVARGRSSADDAEAAPPVTPAPTPPPARPAWAPFDDDMADWCDIRPAPSPPTPVPAGSRSTHDDGPIPGPATPRASPPGPAGESSAFELKEPGPGVLGPLRRPPLAAREVPRPPPTAPAEDRPPGDRQPSGDGCTVTSRPDSRSTKGGAKPRARSTPASSGKVGVGPNRARARNGRVPSLPAVPASRSPAKSTANRAPTAKTEGRMNGQPGVRRAPRRGAEEPSKPARPASRAAGK